MALANRALHNKSDRILSLDDSYLLSHGMSFIPTPKPTNRDEICRRLDIFDRSLRLRWQFRQPREDNDNFKFKFHVSKLDFEPAPAHRTIENFLKNVRVDIEKAMRIHKPPTSKNFRLSSMHRLKLLASDTDLDFRPADKNLGITITNASVVHDKIMNMLSDTSTYLPVTLNHGTAIARRFISRVKALLVQFPHVFKKTAEFICISFPSTWDFPVFYGLPKIHKPGEWTLRPIIPGFNWCTHQLSVWVSDVLNPVVNSLPTCVTSSISLIRQLEVTSFPSDADFGTVDVTALYPSIPIVFGVDVVVDVLKAKKFSFQAIHILQICMLLILQSNVFTYGARHYLQIKGTAMGSSFAPPFANLFIYGLEAKFASSWRHLYFYKRYIDDIFFVVRKGFRDLFVRILNTFLTGVIVFTCDFGDNSINFLDLVIFKGTRFAESNRFDFKVFQKSTNLYQYIPYSSDHPMSTKKAFIFGELTRYTTHSSTYEYFREIRFSFYLRLRARGYPSKLLHRIFAQVSYGSRASRINPPIKPTPDQPLFLNLPFDRWTAKLDVGRFLKAHWKDDMYGLDIHFHPSPPKLVYSKGRSIFDIVRTLQKRARAELLRS